MMGGFDVMVRDRATGELIGYAVESGLGLWTAWSADKRCLMRALPAMDDCRPVIEADRKEQQ